MCGSGWPLTSSLRLRRRLRLLSVLILLAFLPIVNIIYRTFCVPLARGPPALVERFRFGGSHQGESASPPGSSKAGMAIPALASKLHLSLVSKGCKRELARLPANR
jgi:hypothetical protein